MAQLGEDRISHLAHVAIDAIRGVVTVRDERLALLEAKNALSAYFRMEDRLDDVVRGRIPKGVPLGSPEWDVMYRKYMEEERRKAR